MADAHLDTIQAMKTLIIMDGVESALWSFKEAIKELARDRKRQDKEWNALIALMVELHNGILKWNSLIGETNENN